MYDSSAEPPKTKVASKAFKSDSEKKVERRTNTGKDAFNGYRPTSSRHSKAKVRNNEKVHPRQQDDTQRQPQPQVSQDRRPQPSSKVNKATSFIPGPLWFESDHTLDDSFHQEEKKETESQAVPQEVKKPVKKERSSSMQQESRDSTESRPDRKPRRSSASDSLASSTHSARRRVTMRKLSEPMHRCSHTNASVNGIMRPARYSSTNLSGMVATTSPPALPSNGRIRKSTSQLTLSTYSTHSLSNSSSSNRLSNEKLGSLSSASSLGSLEPSKSSKPRRTMSIADMANANWNSHPALVDQRTKDEWVASGVAFSKNMEVYVFKK